MNWQTDWRALSARIKGLLDAANYMAATAVAVGSDFHGVANAEIIPNAKRIADELHTFEKVHGDSIPGRAKEALSRFLITFKNTKGSSFLGWAGMQASVALLISFRAEFEHLLADSEAVARALTRRALIHLQRSLIVDDLLTGRWRAALAKGETECEKLGGVHLLAHGIWAFKTSDAGERTDLILGEPLRITDEVRGSAEALVLTEWKLVRTPREAEEKAQQALRQARRYAEGILAGFELSTTRYLILVSEDFVRVPAAVTDDGVTYQYFNLAVSPLPPSRARV